MDGVKVIYEDKNFYILSKDHGIACQSKSQNDIEKEFKNSHFITRLDQPASGLLVLAKESSTAAKMSKWLDKGTIVKTYVALVEGKIAESSGTLSDHLIKKGAKAFSNKKEKGSSFLHYTVHEELERFTLIDVSIDSGKFHQIRAQLSSSGMHIKGDLKYGAKRSNKEGGIYLCCNSIAFPDTNTGLPMQWKVHPSDFSLPLWKFYKE